MDILVVDDEADIRNLIQGILEDEGYATRAAQNSKEAYEALKKSVPDALILDIWLHGSKDDGLAILKEVKRSYPLLPVIMISGHGTIETAVAAIRDGAYDFIEKPFKSDRLLLMISRALETAGLRRENASLKKQTSNDYQDLLGKSGAIQTVHQLIERVAPTNSRVLISGEAGVGKDVVARNIHKHSIRADEAFVVVNCATLRAESFEAELFGVAGLQSRDEAGHAGLLEQANQGTLFLDEISDMPLETQGKIVRVLQEKRFQRLGDPQKYDVDVRVLASTNQDLEALIRDGKFREDLYYRINVVPLSIPPLRERVQDIPIFSAYFLEQTLRKFGQSESVINADAIDCMQSYEWPGNVRQLRNVIEWMVIMHGAHVKDGFGAQHLPSEVSGMNGAKDLSVLSTAVLSDKHLSLPLRDAREVFEREYLLSQVEKFNGNISKTAKFVGMERSALHRKLKSLQINIGKDLASDDERDELKQSKRA